jgi:hypothetical protein
MDYYFDLRFCPFWDRDGPFRDRESAVWDRCGPVGARLGPFSTGFGPVSDRLRFQLLGHEIRTAFCIVFTLVFDVGDSHEKSAFRDHPRRRARSARTTSTISATSFNAWLAAGYDSLLRDHLNTLPRMNPHGRVQP